MRSVRFGSDGQLGCMQLGEHRRSTDQLVKTYDHAASPYCTCGARLSKYNPDPTRCNPCQKGK